MEYLHYGRADGKSQAYAPQVYQNPHATPHPHGWYWNDWVSKHNWTINEYIFKTHGIHVSSLAGSNLHLFANLPRRRKSIKCKVLVDQT